MDGAESIGFDFLSMYSMVGPPGRCGQPKRLSISVGRKAVGNSRTPKGLSTGRRQATGGQASYPVAMESESD